MPDIVFGLGVLIVIFCLGTFLTVGQRNLVKQVRQIMVERKLTSKYPDNDAVLKNFEGSYALGIVLTFLSTFTDVLVVAFIKSADLYPTFIGSMLLAGFNSLSLVYLYNVCETWPQITKILEQMDLIPQRNEDE